MCKVQALPAVPPLLRLVLSQLLRATLTSGCHKPLLRQFVLLCEAHNRPATEVYVWIENGIVLLLMRALRTQVALEHFFKCVQLVV